MTTVLYEGNDVVPWCTELHIAQSFRDIGVDVIFAPTGRTTPEQLAAMLLEHKPDLFLLTRPWGTTSAATPDFLAMCRTLGVPTAGFHLDLFWGLPERERWICERSDPIFTLDHLFTTDGGHEAEWAAEGINHHWMPPGVLASECYDAEPDRELWPYEVAFVGSAPTADGGNYHPDHAHRPEMVAKLRERYGPSFVHVGNGGDRPTTRGHDLNVLYASVPVIVGDSCLVQRDRPYWSDRVPETWGRGGFLVHPRVDALRELIGPYPGDMWEPGDWDAMFDQIDGYLGDAYACDNTRERIAAIVRAGHTYTNRVIEMLNTIGWRDREDMPA